jgi:hypothetical protein
MMKVEGRSGKKKQKTKNKKQKQDEHWANDSIYSCIIEHFICTYKFNYYIFF